MESLRFNMPLRQEDGNKGTFGRVCVIGGCENYLGAPILCGKAAYRCGCGLVECIVPEIVRNLTAGSFPEAIWNCEDTYSLNSYFVYALGPGMGQSDHSRERFKNWITAFQKTPVKGFVIDADGLNWLAKEPDLLKNLPQGTVLTPHPGEMSRLCGLPVSEIQSDRLNIAEKCANLWQTTILLKGAHTVIAFPGGEPVVLPYASSALSKAGSGDVLTGVIASLMAQGMIPHEAAVLGASIHAEAGLLAAEHFGNEYSVMAGDIIEKIPCAISRYLSLG